MNGRPMLPIPSPIRIVDPSNPGNWILIDAQTGLISTAAGTITVSGLLAAILALSTNGLVARTSSTTAQARSIATSGGGISIANGSGLGGDPTLSLNALLAAIAGLSSNGLIARTAAGTAAARTLAAAVMAVGSAGGNAVLIANGNGVSGDPTVGVNEILQSLCGQTGLGIPEIDFDSGGVNRVLTIGTEIQAWDALLDALAGGTPLPILNGGTGASSDSAARTALGLAIGTNVQAHNALLAAIAGLGSNGLISRDGSGSASVKVIGTDVQAYDADLAAIAGLSSTGIIARTGSGAASARTLTAADSSVTIADGDGVSGNPTVKLADIMRAWGQMTISGGATATTVAAPASFTQLDLAGFTDTSGAVGITPDKANDRITLPAVAGTYRVTFSGSIKCSASLNVYGLKAQLDGVDIPGAITYNRQTSAGSALHFSFEALFPFTSGNGYVTLHGNGGNGTATMTPDAGQFGVEGIK